MRHSIDVQCPHCHGVSISKAGKTPKGQQRYMCTNPECPKKTSLLHYVKCAWEDGMKEKVIDMVLNGSGIRDTGRVLKIHKDTVINAIKKRKEHCPCKS